MEASAVIEVDDRTFHVQVETSKIPAVVMFYSPTCVHCRAMMPFYAQYALEYKDKILFARIDVSVNLWTGERYGVKGTPTFKFICSGRPVTELVGAVYPAILKRTIDDVLVHGKECVTKSTEINYDVTGYG
ncbi:MAG TPA: thioredoxin domain-containing protein [Methanomicrobiales archaeon]|nr:thioredoxin domain-containing protein [Methanomicrobiales archaeon]